MPRFLAPLSLLFLLGLAACASLNEQECRSADWYQIGVTDGAEGYGTERLEAHRRACARVGVSPNAEQWLEGRERGLRLYCTAPKAYEEGRRGHSIRAGCTPAETRRMMPAWDWGRAWWQIDQQIDDIESDIRSIDDEIALLGPDDSIARARLIAERSRLESRLSILYMRQRRYETWP